MIVQVVSPYLASYRDTTERSVQRSLLAGIFYFSFKLGILGFPSTSVGKLKCDIHCRVGIIARMCRQMHFEHPSNSKKCESNSQNVAIT